MHGRSPLPKFFPGSVIAVSFRPTKSSNVRRIVGIVISIVNRGLASSFTIRNELDGEGFEIGFERYHPLLEGVEVLEYTRRRRAKLYYLKGRPRDEWAYKNTYKGVPFDPKRKPKLVRDRR